MASRYFYLTLAVGLTAILPAPIAAQWTDGQSAVNVVGQSGFGSSVQAVGIDQLSGPTDVALDATNGKLYVADTSNNRVLRFAYPIVTDGPSAEAVFGQPSFSSNTVNNGGRSASSMWGPRGLAVSPAGTLYVSDTQNNRVLVFPSAHLATTSGTAASQVLGQPDFVSGSTATTTAGLGGPLGLAFEAPDRLWVVDPDNSRVVRYEGISSKANGGNADGVLGQPNFTASGSSVTQSRLYAPRGLALYQGALYIADNGANRVLRFDAAASKANGANADGVLGQSNFTSNGQAIAATNMGGPWGAAVDASGRLYVVDEAANRVTIYNAAASKANGAASDFVLGQPGYSTVAQGNAADKVNSPYRAAVDNVNNRLILADRLNHRVLIYQASSPLPVAISSFSAE